MENERNVEKVTDCNKLATPIEEKKTPEELYEQLIETIHRYHPSDDVSMIEKAYHIADKAHGGQKRKSGDPYIIQPASCSDYSGRAGDGQGVHHAGICMTLWKTLL